MADLPPVFKNVNYPYKDQHDTFIARGYHLNLLREAIVERQTGISLPTPLPWGQTTDIVLGPSEEIDACTINYKATFPNSSPIGAQYDETGTLEVNNSSEHANKPALSWTRECTNHGQGFSGTTSVGISFLISVVGGNLIMRLTNNGSTNMQFVYNIVKTLKHAD